MRNIRLIIAYDGSDFHGWQRQPGLPTVQECLEAAIQKLVGMPVELWGSGRTDAGAHASRQVANFKTASPIPCANLLKALNDFLPPTVRVRDAREVADGFHARYDARSKTYRYRVLESPVCPPFIWRFVCHHPYPLDHRSMAAAAKFVDGAPRNRTGHAHAARSAPHSRSPRPHTGRSDGGGAGAVSG